MGRAYTPLIEGHMKLNLNGLSTKFKRVMFHNLINNMGVIVVFFNLNKCLKGTEFSPQALIRLQRYVD